MHGMCQVPQTASVCQSRIQEYQDSLWEQKSLQGFVEDSRQLIMDYDKYCGGCIRNYNRVGT